MRVLLIFSAYVIVGFVSPLPHRRKTKPHIIFITADDLGWNDIGWHNKYIMTPHIDFLAKSGVILNQSYVLPTCTPSRSALMTGFYSFRTGRQGGPLKQLANTGLSKNFTILPEVLKKLGYKTHAVGKWHLGFCNEAYTPTYRGFDTFFGGYLGYRDHFTHSRLALKGDPKVNNGLDFWNGTKPVRDYNGVYSSDAWTIGTRDILSKSDPNVPLFLYINFHNPHSPLEAPKSYIQMYSDIADEDRRIYSAMVTALDAAIGRVVSALKEYKFLDDSIIIFTTDNGATYEYGGSNWPLKGAKFSVYEGGTRAVTFVYGDKLKKKGYVNNKLIHLTDWFPTIVNLAGGTTDGLDGMDQWDVISNDAPAVRNEIVYNIYDDGPHRYALRVGKYKLVREKTNIKGACWTPPRYPNDAQGLECEVKTSALQDKLFNLEDDPSERNDIASENPKVLNLLKKRIAQYINEMVPSDNGEETMFGHPFFYWGLYAPGWCEAK